MPILKRSPDGPYLSPGDERAFFEWLKRIPCVREVRGSGPELRLRVRGRRVSSACLRELIALFHRYDVPMQQLAQFESPSNRKWFKNPSAAWYGSVFGPHKPSNKRMQPPRTMRRAHSARRRARLIRRCVSQLGRGVSEPLDE